MGTTTLTYLFDPLCGWCYAASPVVQQLGQHAGIALELAPTGLFAGAGGRTLDAAFAQYAWSNDMRIEKLTGQHFSEDYRTQILGKTGSRFDSAIATLALTAVALTAPQRELQTLKALQEARYVKAQDTCSAAVVEQLLRDLQLGAAAERLAAGDAALHSATAARMHQARGLMQSVGAHAVPTLVVTDDNGRRQLASNALYGSFENLLDHIAAA